MSIEFLTKVYAILVEHAGAIDSESYLQSFILDHLDGKYPCREWRFQGSLGFGGKYRSGRNTIDCYQEDETLERLKTIEKVNELLAAIPKSYSPFDDPPEEHESFA